MPAYCEAKFSEQLGRGPSLSDAESKAQTSALQGNDVDIAQWLRALRVTVPSDEKPAVLHALTLHLIRQLQYREALEELETYLTSYPYLLSGTLHTYAGMLAFYLAQPASLRVDSADGQSASGFGNGPAPQNANRGHQFDIDNASETPSRTHSPAARAEAPNPSLMRQARGWFIKAQDIGKDEVAAEFVRVIDDGTHDPSPDISDEDEDDTPATPSRQKQPSSLFGMLHPPSESDDDEDQEADMMEYMHEYE